MRISEFGRWFRFLSVVSLMLVGLSINLWATPSITTAPTSQAVAGGSDVTGSTVSFTGAGTSSNSTKVSYIWNYFDGGSGTWVNFVPGAGTGVLQGATVSFLPANSNPQTNVSNGTTTTLKITNVPTSANGLQIQLEVTDASSASGTTAYSSTVTLSVGATWAADGTLPSGVETFERLVLLPNNGPLLAIGSNNPESNAGVTTINVDVTPGVIAAPSGPETWTAAAQTLPVALVRPTATLLPNGTVLIAGGLSGVTDSNAAYLFTYGHSLVSTGTLTDARDAHTASLLPTGLVLVAGGSNNGHILTSAELYNPVLGSWSAAQSLNVARYNHTATTLADGRVLVAGGFNALGPIASAEIYDPIQNTWTATGSNLVTARAYHTATLLPNGKVLIAGGVNSVGAPIATAELFDPTLGTFVSLGDTSPNALFTAREQATANLQAGGKVLIAGGFTASGATATSEYYDYTTGLFSQTEPLIQARDAHAAVLVPSGDVVAAGGIANGTSLASAEKFWDPAQGTASTPSAVIHLGNNAVAGQWLGATCGQWNGSAYVVQPGVQYAWTIVDGQTGTLPQGVTQEYPNYTAVNGIYTGDTSTIEFIIPASEAGNTLKLSCLATSSLGIPGQSTLTSPNIATGSGTSGIPPISTISNNVDGFATNVTVLQGASVTFGAQAFGAPSVFDYQWQFYNPSTGWVNWSKTASGATCGGSSECLNIPSAKTSEDGMELQVLVTNATGTEPSNNQQTLYVVATPQNVAATCAAPLANCTITSTEHNQGPGYIYGAPGPAVLTASYTLPVASQLGIGGSVNAVSYQWCTTSTAATPSLATPTSCTGIGISLIGGATSKTYSANPHDGGVYYYYVVVTNTLNSTPNSEASPYVAVTVDSLPDSVTVLNTICSPTGTCAPTTGLSVIPSNVETATNSIPTPTIQSGDNIVFSAQINGEPYPTSYTYQWQYYNPKVGWANWGTGATQGMNGVLGRSDSMQVRVAVTNSVGTWYSNAITLYVVLKPTNVTVTLSNCTVDGHFDEFFRPSLWTNNPIAQGNSACLTASDTAEPGNTTDYTWYEVGNNPEAGGPDLPLNTWNHIALSSCDALIFLDGGGFRNRTIASTMAIDPACLGDGGSYYAVATNLNTDAGGSIPLITSPTTTSNTVPLTVNVGTWSVVTTPGPELSQGRFEGLGLLLPTLTTDGNLFVFDGGLATAGLPPAKSYETYLPSTTTTGGWTLGGSSSYDHLNGTITLFNGGTAPWFMLAGGTDGSENGQTGLEYAAYGSASTSNVSLPVPTTQQVAALLPSQSILLAGGQDGGYNTFYNKAYLVTPGTTLGTNDTIATSAGVLGVARAGAALVTLPATASAPAGRLLIVGGQGNAGPVNAVDIYDPWASDWTSGAPSSTLYPASLYGVTTPVSTRGIAGDYFAQAISSTSAALPKPLINHTATLLEDGRVLIAGGENASGVVQNTLLIWDPAANNGAGEIYPLGTATPGGASVTNPVAGTLLTARQQHQAVLLENGSVLIFGGTDKNGAVLNSAEVVDPNWVYPPCASYTPQCPTAPTTLNASIPASSLNYARTLASSTLLQNGSTLAAGGYDGSAALAPAVATEVFNALEGYSTATPTPDGAIVGSPYYAGELSATVTFTPYTEITNYSWSVSPAGSLASSSGQGTSTFTFNTATQGDFTVTLGVTDEWGITEVFSIVIHVTGTGWTWDAPSSSY